MKQIDKIVKSQSEPKDINVLWLDTNDPKSPILKAYADGEWKAISSEEGGGGSAEGAVSYEPQELTEEQQMQARLNQGLYAEGPSLSIEWDGDTTGKDVFRGEYYRVADYVYIEDGTSLVGTGEFEGETFTEELVAIDRSENAGVAKGTIIELTESGDDFVVAVSFNNFSFNGVTLDGVYFQEHTRKIEVPGEVYNKIPSKFIEGINQIYKVIIAYNENAYKLHEMKDSSGNIIGANDIINAMSSGKTIIAEYNKGNKHYFTQNVFRQRNNFIVFLFVIGYDYNRGAVYLAGYPGSRDGEAQVYDKNATPSSTSYYASVTNMKDKLINFLIAEFANNEAVHVDSFMLPAFDYDDLTVPETD